MGGGLVIPCSRLIWSKRKKKRICSFCDLTIDSETYHNYKEGSVLNGHRGRLIEAPNFSKSSKNWSLLGSETGAGHLLRMGVY